MCLHNCTHILFRFAFGTLLSWLALAGTSTALDTSGTVRLAWTPNLEADVAGYIVHFGSASGNLSQSLQVSTSPAATVSGLEPGSTYYCAVQAFSTAGLNSLLSPEISFVVPVPGAPEISLRQASGNVLVSTESTIDLGTVAVGGAAPAEVITITNLGTSALSGLAVTTTGQDFAVSPLATATLAPGDSTNFNVTFSPSATGSRSASVLVASNDGDENPFEIHFAGTGLVAPEIAIEQPGGVNLTDGSANVYFSNSTLDTTGTPVTFTIRNTGNATLTGLATTVGGTGSGDFVVGAPAMIALAPGATTTFQVAFKPTVSGTRTATLHVASNDADENPFDIELVGSGIALPEIAVTRADATELADGGVPLAFGSIDPGSASATQVLTVRNLGTANLTGLAITTDGVHPSDFVISSLGTAFLAPGASAAFQVSFRPTGAGPRTAALRIASNDADETSFDIALTGMGNALPFLSVEQADGTPLAPDTPVIPFGRVVAGGISQARTYIVRNTGTAVLTGLQVAAAGSDAASFDLIVPPVTSLAPGDTTAFSVAFKPVGHGFKTAAIHVNGNLATFQEPVEIGVTGDGVGIPEISIVQGSELENGSAALDYGSLAIAVGTLSKEITIKNTGTADLTGLAVASSGPAAADFKASTLAATSLAPGESAIFKVSFKPSAAGIRTARLAITSNDADESPFAIVLGGIGAASPEIKVLHGSNKNLKDDSAVIDLGTMAVAFTSAPQVLTIRNTGTAKLSKLAVAKNGLHSSDFTISALKVKSLAPGASTTLKVYFKPSKTGIRWGAIHISSNDSDEKSFDIVLTGTGKAAKTSTKTTTVKALSAPVARPPASPITLAGIEVIGGRKYRTVTVTKSSGTILAPGDIQVSSNLLNWFSGRNHTTALLNNATTLKVRDNTPVTQEVKRYIRLSPTAISR